MAYKREKYNTYQRCVERGYSADCTRLLSDYFEDHRLQAAQKGLRFEYGFCGKECDASWVQVDESFMTENSADFATWLKYNKYRVPIIKGWNATISDDEADKDWGCTVGYLDGENAFRHLDFKLSGKDETACGNDLAQNGGGKEWPHMKALWFPVTPVQIVDQVYKAGDSFGFETFKCTETKNRVAGDEYVVTVKAFFSQTSRIENLAVSRLAAMCEDYWRNTTLSLLNATVPAFTVTKASNTFIKEVKYNLFDWGEWSSGNYTEPAEENKTKDCPFGCGRPNKGPGADFFQLYYKARLP